MVGGDVAQLKTDGPATGADASALILSLQPQFSAFISGSHR